MHLSRRRLNGGVEALNFIYQIPFRRSTKRSISFEEATAVGGGMIGAPTGPNGIPLLEAGDTGGVDEIIVYGDPWTEEDEAAYQQDQWYVNDFNCVLAMLADMLLRSNYAPTFCKK